MLRGVLPGGTRICAAVKANAYGFGLLPVARTLVDAGVDALGMVDIRDAVRLREDGIGCPILLYGGSLLDERTMPRIREHELIVTVSDEPLAGRRLPRSGSRYQLASSSKWTSVWNASGSVVDKAPGLVRAAASSGSISLEGVYTHMHVPPDAAPQYLDWQFGRFQALVSAMRRRRIFGRYLNGGKQPGAHFARPR